MFKKFCVVRCIVAGLLLSTISLNALAERVITPPPYKDMQGRRLSSIECLAVNSYMEGRGESDIANTMIMSTVLNRVGDKRFPDTICGVVFQRRAYSWTSDSLSDEITNLVEYKRLYKLSEDFIINRDLFLSMSEQVNHYHAVSVAPYWSKSEQMKYVTTIDNHKFYQRK